MGAQGYINNVGRLKHTIIRGGENLFPAEIEEFLVRHPKVADVRVLGGSDTFFGEEELLAVVIPKAGEPLTDPLLRSAGSGGTGHRLGASPCSKSSRALRLCGIDVEQSPKGHS